METREDQAVNAIIESIVAFRARYGYARKLDDPELHAQLIMLLREYASTLQIGQEHMAVSGFEETRALIGDACQTAYVDICSRNGCMIKCVLDILQR